MEEELLIECPFLAWTENGETAIALCDSYLNGNMFFVEAINCCRDGDMGEKDEKGVYQRHWYGDYIENGQPEKIRYATKEEVELYLEYCNPSMNPECDRFEYVGVALFGQKYFGMFKDNGTADDFLTQETPVSTKEQKRRYFNEYMNELAVHYKKTGSLKGMSAICAKYPVQAITKEQFYLCGMNIAAKKGLFLDRPFTDKVYEFIKDRKGNAEAPLFRG